jgi:hypothetical protein
LVIDDLKQSKRLRHNDVICATDNRAIDRLGEIVDKRAGEDGETGSPYDDELLSANWNPAVNLVAPASTRRGRRKERDVSEAEASAFLRRIYQSGA